MQKLVILLAALCLSGSQASVTVTRGDTPESTARTLTNPECTSIYTVALEAKFSTQGNDVAMIATHGKDTRIAASDARYKNFNDQPGFSQGTLVIGADYRDFPFANDPAKQAAARAQFSVTALTEPTGTPMGFVRSTSRMYYSVCVSVSNTAGRWVEIMAETAHANQQICVSDWARTDLADNPFQESCGNGNVYACRETPLGVTANSASVMGLQFYCKDACDDAAFDFYWRVTASQLQSVSNNKQPDGENWCSMRDGDDYPSSLLDPYPAKYDAPAVFDRLGGSASSATVTATSVLALAALAFLRYLF